jgi:hypothetical protein
MNFLRLNHFLKLIKGFGKKKTHGQRHVSEPGCSTWHADVMTSVGGLGLLTSAVGPTDAALTGQR